MVSIFFFKFLFGGAVHALSICFLFCFVSFNLFWYPKMDSSFQFLLKKVKLIWMRLQMASTSFFGHCT